MTRGSCVSSGALPLIDPSIEAALGHALAAVSQTACTTLLLLLLHQLGGRTGSEPEVLLVPPHAGPEADLCATEPAGLVLERRLHHAGTPPAPFPHTHAHRKLCVVFARKLHFGQSPYANLKLI